MAYPNTQDLKIRIGGSDRTSVIPCETIRIDQVLGRGVATARFRVVDGGALGVSELDTVMITNVAEDERYFAGFLTILEKRLVTPICADLLCTCQDYTWLLGKAVVNERYEDQSDSAIIADLFSTYLDDIDATTYVDTLVEGTALAEVGLARVTLLRALDALAAAAGAEWYVDFGPGSLGTLAYLHYYEGATNVATYDISDSPDLATTFPAERMRLIRDAVGHVNRVIVVGGDYLSSDALFYLPADNLATEVLLPYELEPADGETQVLVWQNDGTEGVPSWTSKTVGYDYVDNLTDYQVLFNKTQKLLKWATAPPDLKNAVKVSARYEVPLRKRRRSYESHTEYGRWLDGVMVDSSVVSKEMAARVLMGELEDRAVVDEVRCRVREPGLVLGSVCKVTNTVLGVDKRLRLVRMGTRFVGGGNAVFDLVLRGCKQASVTGMGSSFE